MKNANMNETPTTATVTTATVTTSPSCIAEATLTNPMRVYDETITNLSLIVAPANDMLLVDEDNSHLTSVFELDVDGDVRMVVNQSDFEELKHFLSDAGIEIPEEELVGILYNFFLLSGRDDTVDVIQVLYKELLRKADVHRCWEDMMSGVLKDYDEGTPVNEDDDGWPYND